MASFLLNRELPNLKVAVENTSGDEDEEHMDCDEEQTDENSISSTRSSKDEPVSKPKEVHSPITGETAKSTITQEEIDALYKSLGVNVKHPSGASRGMRLDAIHIRGVNEMSTEDIMEYFKDYDPDTIEWINDFSCNVVWKDKNDAARALLGLSKPVVVKWRAKSRECDLFKDKETSGKSPLEKQKSSDSSDAKTDKDDKTTESVEEVVVMSEDEFSDDSDTSMPDVKSSEVPQVDVSEVEVPVPPGQWRLGVTHSKARTLLLRFSSKMDRKFPGAEKRSDYYRKYGNPNYGGLQGLISNTRKRKTRQGLKGLISNTRKRKIRQGNQPEDSQKSSGSYSKDDDEGNKVGSSSKRNGPKRMRMRMYADEEEEKQKRKKKAAKATPQTPWSTPDDSPASDVEEKVKSEIRGTVWERLAGGRSMNTRNSSKGRWRYEDLDDPSRFEEDDRNMYPTDLRERIRNPSNKSSSRNTSSFGKDLRSKLESIRKNRRVDNPTPLRIHVTNDSD